MARLLKKQITPRQQFETGLFDAFTKPIPQVNVDTGVWDEEPVDIITFCETYREKPLWPIQEGFAEEIIGTNPYEISQRWKGGNAFWGKGAGKDVTIADLQSFIAYWLMCLKHPQRYLREELRCSIEDHDAIDIANVSINERQAKNVFFKKFKAAVRNTVNPRTGGNWFAEHGVDLREGQDIQKTEINFAHEITAHSLNSETHTGEGYNLFFVTVDEFGVFDIEKAFTLLKALRRSCTSRFKRVGKVCVISYKYNENDPMHILYETEKNSSEYYTSKASTYEVNPYIERSDLQQDYIEDPDGAKRTFECGVSQQMSAYITRPYMIKKAFEENEFENPVIGNLVSVIANSLQALQFKDFFRPKAGARYAFHADLALGKVSRAEGGGDAAGFALVHPEYMMPVVDHRIVKELEAMNVYVDPESTEVKKGILIDLMLQIVAPVGSEIELSSVKEFVFRLKRMGFPIVFGSFDGWQSIQSVQELNAAGIKTELLSVDKDNTPYDLVWKELLYQQLLKGYPHKIAQREAKELIINEKNKVDHPEKSYERFANEGNLTSKGSKDVGDSITGAGYSAWNRISLHTGIGFGTFPDSSPKKKLPQVDETKSLTEQRIARKVAAMVMDEDDLYG